ncbi:hypothetical protein V5799_033637 [Amblyomma americanum]|uniref:Uncharacterized protein n=1 Tax=Amblyomma americanum TaxID=6943 RepID=A0AAQ4DMR4_AMBAM
MCAHSSVDAKHQMTGMCLRATILFPLVACATASVWRTNFIIDRLLPTIGLKEVPLHDISFDVDHAKGTFSGFVEFHLQKGTLGNFHQRVRRSRDCSFKDYRKWSSPHFYIGCFYSLRGLVAKYDVEVIVDRKSKWMETQVLVSDGKLDTYMDSYLGDCTKCTLYIRELPTLDYERYRFSSMRRSSFMHLDLICAICYAYFAICSKCPHVT